MMINIHKQGIYAQGITAFSVYEEAYNKKVSKMIENRNNNKNSIDICVERSSWIIDYLDLLIEKLIGMRVNVSLSCSHYHRSEFKNRVLLGYTKIIEKEYLNTDTNWMVVHESDLPEGKGWSPMTWQVIEGRNRIIGTLFSPNEKVDDGKILSKASIEVDDIKNVDEMRRYQIKLTAKLILIYFNILPKEEIQKDENKKVSMYRRRCKDDSYIELSQKEQNLLKTIDNIKYPLWTKVNGVETKLIIEQ